MSYNTCELCTSHWAGMASWHGAFFLCIWECVPECVFVLPFMAGCLWLFYSSYPRVGDPPSQIYLHNQQTIVHGPHPP